MPVLGYASCNGDDITPFDAIFDKKKSILDGIQGVDCVIFWGGTDIHPSYYKQGHHPASHAPALPSNRDMFEWKAMRYCQTHGIPMIGVCRGAQLACAYAGGSLVQDVQGHHRDHFMTTSDGRKIYTTSSHHQMMNPYNIEHVMLAWSTDKRSYSYEDGNELNIPEMHEHEEPEVVFFPETKTLAIQGHPEYQHALPDFRSYCLELVKEYLLK